MPGRTPPPPAPQELPRVAFWRLRRNPLRRRSDRLQGWIGLGLVLAALAATPAVVFLVGDAARHHYTRIAQHQSETRHRAIAVLLEDARRHPEPGSAEAKKTRYPTKVRFTDSRGHPRTATADVEPAKPRGSIIRVWTDTGGRITAPPLDPSEIRVRAVGSGIIAALGVHTTTAVVYGIASRVLHRHNLAAWDTAWAETAPRWTTSP
ncbi:hypothetical protein [Streptomyces sp. NPDC094149]|uniref:Rv1733c family protein n=1 Tax=Streptomyces sp. NPDC094149 TaxID=3155079 RepID=UPI0033285E2C